MNTQAKAIIEEFGGTSALARLLNAPNSTVQSWKKIGIPASRMAHIELLRRVGQPSDIAA